MTIRLLILFLFGCYLWRIARNSPRRTLSMPMGIGYVIGLFLVLAGLSAILSPYPNQSFQWMIVLCSYALLLYLVVFLVDGWDHTAKLLAVLAGMGILEAMLAISQGLLGATRPAGTFFNTNFLAGYLVAIFIIVCGWVSFSKLEWRKGRTPRLSGLPPALSVLSLSGLVVLIIAVFWTGSRGGMLALLGGGSVVLGARLGRRALVVLALLMAAWLLVPNPVRDRMWSEYTINPIGYARVQIWQSSLREMREHPSGIGLGLYQYFYPRYAFPIEGMITRYGNTAETAHNEYIQMGVELGMVSIVIFFCGLGLAARSAMAVLRERMHRWQRGTVVGLCGAIVSIVVHAAVDSNFHEPGIAVLFILCVGMLLALARREGKSRMLERPISSRAHLLRVSSGIVILLLMLASTLRLGLAWLAYEEGVRAVANGDLQRAVVSYWWAIGLDGGKSLHHNALAAAYFKQFKKTGDRGAAQSALDELDVATRLNPLDGKLYGLKGFVYATLASTIQSSQSSDIRREQWNQQALAAYEQASALEPFSAFYRFEVGRLHQAMGDRTGGEVFVRQAVELEPNFLPGREWLARFYWQSGRAEAARQEYKEILERQRRYEGWSKGALESTFLKADVNGLASLLGQTAPRI